MADLTATRHLAHAPEPIARPVRPETPAERDALFEARDTAVREHPSAYLRARWRVLEHVLGIGKRHKDWSGAYTEFAPSLDASISMRHRARHSAVQEWLIRPVAVLSHTLLLRPVLYALLALVLLGVAIVRRDREALLWLVSGIGYELAQLFDVVHPQYRDSHWLLVATALAAVIAIARWRSEPGDERVGDQA